MADRGIRAGCKGQWRFTPTRAVALCVLWFIAAASLHAAQDLVTPPTSLVAALPAEPTGEEIFRQACATCHAVDGSGSPQSVVGFALPLPNGHEFPDFNDCPTNTVEPLGDWVAVATRGGPIRGLDRHMPAFGDALSADQIEKAVKYLWSFCTDPAWPRGDLNFPRAFFTEKAFPENETVWTTGVTASGAQGGDQRAGLRAPNRRARAVRGEDPASTSSRTRRWQLEHRARRRRAGTAADVLCQLRSRQHLRRRAPRRRCRPARRTVASATASPCSSRSPCMARCSATATASSSFTPATRSRRITAKGRTKRSCAPRFGYSIAQDEGFGRVWSPMAEVIVAKPEHGAAEWDVVPQMQVSLSKLQHVLLNVGVRVPLNEREDRKPQLLTYFLWDWFDGGLFQFWK